MNPLKILTAIALIASIPSMSFAGACDGIDLKGAVQLIPLDGTASVLGTLDEEPIQAFMGGSVSVAACKAETNSDGSVSLVFRWGKAAKEHEGEIGGDLGKITFESKKRSCELTWTWKDKTRQLKLVAKSPNGDLILSDVGTSRDDVYGIEAPTLILRKITQGKLAACPAGQVLTKYGCLFQAQGGQCPKDGKTYAIYNNQCLAVE